MSIKTASSGDLQDQLLLENEQLEQYCMFDYNDDEEYDEDDLFNINANRTDFDPQAAAHEEELEDVSGNGYASRKLTERDSRLANLRKRTERQMTIGGKNLDYLGLAAQYKQTRPYSDPNYYAVCVLCNVEEAEDVFFPCEHRCICRSCIAREEIVPESQMKDHPDGHSYCSLCATVIKLILPAECGLEVDKYWDWVYEVPVALPKGFLRNFRHSAGVIRTVYLNDGLCEGDSRERKSSEVCTIS